MKPVRGAVQPGAARLESQERGAALNPVDKSVLCCKVKRLSKTGDFKVSLFALSSGMQDSGTEGSRP